MARTPTQWAFDYEALSHITDLSTEAIRQAKSRGEFNPEIFGSVVSWVAKHGNLHMRQEIMESLLMRQYPKKKNVSDDPGAAMVDEHGRSAVKAPRLVPSPIEASPKKKSAKKSRPRS